jgi:hypothetical protein
MTQNIQDVLGCDFLMFYHPGLSITELTPVQTLTQCVEISNHLLDLYGSDFSQWNPVHQDIIARLMNVNWIHQRLVVEPIRKPVLVHKEQSQLIVDCGDTRIMALEVLKHPPCLSAIITVRATQAHEYCEWIPVGSNEDLIRLVGFDFNSTTIALTTAKPGLDWCISWFEIGDYSTSFHLHDINFRARMLQNWIKTQPKDFRFSADWVTWPIDWAMYQPN